MQKTDNCDWDTRVPVKDLDWYQEFLHSTKRPREITNALARGRRCLALLKFVGIQL